MKTHQQSFTLVDERQWERVTEALVGNGLLDSTGVAAAKKLTKQPMNEWSCPTIDQTLHQEAALQEEGRDMNLH